MGFSKRSSLTGGRGVPDGELVVGVVKKVDKAPNAREKKVDVRLDDARKAHDSIYVREKDAKEIVSGKKYAFHLEDMPDRGGGNSRFTANMIRRSVGKPEEIHESGFGGSSKGGFSRSW